MAAKGTTETKSPFETVKTVAVLKTKGAMEMRVSIVKIRDRVGLDLRKFSGPGKDALPLKGIWMEPEQWADVLKALPKAVEAARKVR